MEKKLVLVTTEHTTLFLANYIAYYAYRYCSLQHTLYIWCRASCWDEHCSETTRWYHCDY
jgi:hypothetical protein